jgi:hypothetical protein
MLTDIGDPPYTYIKYKYVIFSTIFGFLEETFLRGICIEHVNMLINLNIQGVPEKVINQHFCTFLGNNVSICEWKVTSGSLSCDR